MTIKPKKFTNEQYDRLYRQYQTVYIELSDYIEELMGQDHNRFLPDFRIGTKNGKKFYALRMWDGAALKRGNILPYEFTMYVWEGGDQ